MALSVSRGVEELNSLSACYAVSVSSASSDDSSVAAIVELQIPPAPDLIIQTHVFLTFSFPCDYPRASLIIRTLNPDVFPTQYCHVSEDGTISLPWEQQSKYSAAVLFHGIRNSLRSASFAAHFTPPMFAASVSLHPSDLSCVSLIAGSGSTKGRRPYMEDVSFHYPNISVSQTNSVSVFGVLDGHGGDDCARFAAEELTPQVVSALRSSPSGDMPRCLFDAFLNTDAAYLKHRSSNAGCTATVLLFHHTLGLASLAHCGDTRAVLARQSSDGVLKAVDLSRDMKATCPIEVARIAAAGGFISNGRVLGSLAVARALGNAPLKESPQEKNKILISAPEVTSFRFDAGDRLIIIATDGLWDVMSSQAAVDMAVTLLSNRGVSLPVSCENSSSSNSITADLKSVAETMAQHAVNALRSADNVTIMLIVVARDLSRPSYPASIPFHVTRTSSPPLLSPLCGAESTVISQRAPEHRVETYSPSSAIDDDDLMRFLQDDENF